MSEPTADVAAFRARFTERSQAERYRDRFHTGKRARKDRLERAILGELLSGLGPLTSALDLPSGTGRLSTVLAEAAGRVIQADAALPMLQLARADHPGLRGGHLQTDAAAIGLADGCVDVVFCHRMLHHMHDAATRGRMFRELARVSRRYLILSYYPPGHRDTWRAWLWRLGLRRQRFDPPAPLSQFLAEASGAGLTLVKKTLLRRSAAAGVFCVFERT